MQLALPGAPHLTYCTNIHAGESLAEIEAALAEHLPRVKRQVSPDRPMGVGLRLSAVAARALSDAAARNRFKRFLADGGFYVFTVNAFPYGSFHGVRIKEQVYEPDWRSAERLRFTNEVADILADIAPDDLTASISTVPGAFRTKVTTPADVEKMAEGFVRAAAHLDGIFRRSGHAVVLAIEPEPACYLETTAEAVRFFQEHLFSAAACALFARLTDTPAAQAEAALRRHLGLCFDVCHSAVAFEDIVPTLAAVRSAGILVAKVQLSAALRATGEPAHLARLLGRFDDGIYLHQTVERRGDALTRHTDLPAAFEAARRGEGSSEWRVHCHVPVFLDRFDALDSTQPTLREVLALCRTQAVSPHLEVETYTWSVLPQSLRSPEIVGDIVRELQWVRTELGA